MFLCVHRSKLKPLFKGFTPGGMRAAQVIECLPIVHDVLSLNASITGHLCGGTHL